MRPRAGGAAWLFVVTAPLAAACAQSQNPTALRARADVTAEAPIDRVLIGTRSGATVASLRTEGDTSVGLIELSVGAQLEPTLGACDRIHGLVLVGSARFTARGEAEQRLTAGDSWTLQGPMRASLAPLDASARIVAAAIREPGCSGRRAAVWVRRRSDVPERAQPGGDLVVSLYAHGSEAAGATASFARLHAPATTAVPAHEHERSSEWLFIVRGGGHMRIGTREVSVGPGAIIRVPPQTTHDYRPTGEAPLEAVQWYVPPGPEARFLPPREAARAATSPL